MIVQHKFLNKQIDPETEILIIGTFNPDTEKNPADFFYGRSRNHLWKLLPKAFNYDILKGKTKEEKINFSRSFKIDFIDLISKVEIVEGQETNYYDKYLDGRVIEWRGILDELKKLKNIKKVCFTRKSFSDIPIMKKKIKEIQLFCQSKNIKFQFLETPARFYNSAKQEEWSNFFKNDN